MPKKKTALTIEERLQQALVPAEEQPYEVPENWVWVRLGSLADVKGGKRLPKGTTFSENITKHPYIRVTDFNAIGVSLEGLKYIDEDVYEKISRYTISSDDIYVSIAGSIGKVGIIPSCIDGANLTENAAKITNIKGINQKYLCLFLKSEFAQYQMQSATIATTQAKLALFRIESLTFPLPPLSEQQHIVERIEELFAKLDEAKERLQEVADSFAVRKAAILHKAFTGELTKQWRWENGVSDESWEEKKFDDCIEKMQNGLSKRKGDEGNNIGVLRLANLSEDDLVLDDLRYILLTEKEEKNYLLSKDDVIMIRVNGSKDNVARQIVINTDEKLAFCDHIIRIKYNPNIVARYVMYFSKTNAYRKYVEDNMVSSAGQNTISRKGLASLVIPLPSIEEQHEIVRLIDDLLARERAGAAASGAAGKLKLNKNQDLGSGKS